MGGRKIIAGGELFVSRHKTYMKIMRYILPLIISLHIFILPFLGNKNISWEMAILIFGYFWFGVAIGEEIEKQDN